MGSIFSSGISFGNMNGISLTRTRDDVFSNSNSSFNYYNDTSYVDNIKNKIGANTSNESNVEYFSFGNSSNSFKYDDSKYDVSNFTEDELTIYNAFGSNLFDYIKKREVNPDVSDMYDLDDKKQNYGLYAKYNLSVDEQFAEISELLLTGHSEYLSYLSEIFGQEYVNYFLSFFEKFSKFGFDKFIH